MELKNTRDRLRKKLEEKKRKLAEQEELKKKNESNKIQQDNEEFDLDELAKEIEGL